MKFVLDITLTEYDTLVHALYAYDECVRDACLKRVVSSELASALRNSIMTVSDKITDSCFDALTKEDY